MASSSCLPLLSNVVSVCGQDVGIYTHFPVDESGFATISAFELSMRFSLQECSLFLDREIFDPITSLVSARLRESCKVSTDGTIFWELGAGKYTVYGLTGSQMSEPTQRLTPRQLTSSTFRSPPLVRVKIESGTQQIIDLSDSSDEDFPFHQDLDTKSHQSADIPFYVNPPPCPSQLTPRVESETCVTSPSSFVTPVPDCPQSTASNHPSAPVHTSIKECLKQLKSMPGKRSVLNTIDFDTIPTTITPYLPPEYNKTCMFILPPAGSTSTQLKAKSMMGMDKHFDGHVWTKTQTSNISNPWDLSFRLSRCVGHLRCVNPKCDYLHRQGRLHDLNETEFEGFSQVVFSIGGPPPKGSTLVCRVCKTPPTCLASCPAQIYYVHGSLDAERACIHLGTHVHDVKPGHCRASRNEIEKLLQKYAELTPKAPHSEVVLEASKDFLSQFLLNDEGCNKMLSLEELEPVLSQAKDLTSPAIRKTVTSFKSLGRLEEMDGIAKLRGTTSWAFVQTNRFPGQGDPTDKVFVFKMSEVGLGSGVDLVRRMQPGGELENAWMMFDHVKRVKKWTTMACHVYELKYRRVMTIAYCEFQSKDTEAQVLF